MQKKNPRILYFINGSMPSDEAFEKAEALGGNVGFRNAMFVPESGCLEKCDGVAGAVPARYAEAYPTAEKAIEDFENARKVAKAKVAKAVKEKADKAAGKQPTKKELEAAAKKESAEAKKAQATAKKETAEADKANKAVADWTPNT